MVRLVFGEVADELVNGHPAGLPPVQIWESLRILLRERDARPTRSAVADDRPLPLSFGQQRLWFLDRLAPGTVAYNVSDAYRLRGALDLGALEQALIAVVDRHEALRTHYTVIDREPVQVIDPPGGFRLARTDVETDPAPEQSARECALTDAETPFDLARGPLFRARLIRLAPTDHILSIVVHHSVFDHQSLEIWARDVSVAYRAYLSGLLPRFGEPGARYADFAVGQHAAFVGRDGDRHLAYWQHRLAGAPPVLELRADKPRPLVPSHRARPVEFTVSPQLTASLHCLAAEHGATLFMLTLAAYQALLSRHTSVADIVVGFPVSGRWQTAFENTIGFFANSLPARARMAGDPQFTELIAQVRDGILDAYDHVELPFERIVEALAQPRDLSRNPVVQVWFNLIDEQSAGRRAGLSLVGLAVDRFETGKARTRFDVELHLVRTPTGELSGRLLHATDLFEPVTTTRFASHYSTFLQSVAKNPDLRVSEVPIVPPEELVTIVMDWGTASEADR